MRGCAYTYIAICPFISLTLTTIVPPFQEKKKEKKLLSFNYISSKNKVHSKK